MTDFEHRLRAAMAAAAGPPGRVAGRHPSPAPAPCPAGRHGLRARCGRRDRGDTGHPRDTRRGPGWPGPGRQPARPLPARRSARRPYRPARRPPRRAPCSGTASPATAGRWAPTGKHRACTLARSGSFTPARQHALTQPPAAPSGRHKPPPWSSRSATATRPWSRRPPRSAGGSGSWPASTTAGLRTPCPRVPRVSRWPAARSAGWDPFPASYAPGLTMFWQGYVTDLRGCVPAGRAALPGGPRSRVTLAASNGGCGS